MESTLRRTWAEIDLDALAHNYHKLRERIGADVKFLGVVKADAYGHGSVQVSHLLQELGADYLAVSSIDEAVELRLNDVTMPILILGHTPKEQVSRLIEYHITQAVSCEAKALEYSEEERVNAIAAAGKNAEITRFKGLGEISPDEFKHFIGKDIRLDPVTMKKEDLVKDMLEFYMGKNTMERQNFIIDNLVVEEDVIN